MGGVFMVGMGSTKLFIRLARDRFMVRSLI